MSLAFVAGADFDAEVDRIAGAEICAAVAILEAGRRRRDRGVHQTRKRVKRLRGLLRLVRSADEAFYEAENARYRDLARSLSAGRDATAMIETLERFGGGPAGFRTLHERLTERRERIIGQGEAHEAAIMGAIAGFREGLAALGARRRCETPAEAAETIRAGVTVTWNQARKAARRARKERQEDDFHELRKATKYHFMHLALLKPFWPRPYKPRRDAANRLGDLLGDLNDIAVMRVWLAHEQEAGHEAERLLKLMKKQEKALRRDSLAVAVQLFGRKPDEVAAEAAKAFLAAARTRARSRKAQPAPLTA